MTLTYRTLDDGKTYLMSLATYGWLCAMREDDPEFSAESVLSPRPPAMRPEEV